MRRKGQFLLQTVMTAALLPAALGACAQPQVPAASTAAPAVRQDLRATAAAEATAIIQRAEATAIMLKAQSQAEALIAQANEPLGHRSTERPDQPATSPTQAIAETGSTSPTIAQKPGTPAATEEQVVQVTGVGFAGEGGFIVIRFKAPPEEAEGWFQGSVSITDEATGTEYNEIPVMPKVGPLLSKPQIYGQIGYAMLVNKPPWLSPGALVTIVLGNHTFEHVKVE